MGKLDPWILEFKELIDLSVTLFEGHLKSGERIAVVLLDNCVEFMYKAFLRVKKRVVGTGKKHTITHDDWETKVSRRFDELAKAMKENSKLADDLIEESKHYHLIRNNLYHTDTPTKPVDGVFQEQLKLVLKILETLYDTKHTPASKTILEMKPPTLVPKQISPPAESPGAVPVDYVLDDFDRMVERARKRTTQYWKRVDGEWKVIIPDYMEEILPGMESEQSKPPFKIMVSLLRDFPECKKITQIANEVGLHRTMVGKVIAGQRYNHSHYFSECQSGYRLSDEGLYYFIEMERVIMAMFPEKTK